MSYTWNVDNVKIVLADLAKVEDVKSIGVSKKNGLKKVNCFARFFQWIFKGCGAQRTNSSKVVPRINTLLEFLQKNSQNNHDLLLSNENTVRKLIARSEKYEAYKNPNIILAITNILNAPKNNSNPNADPLPINNSNLNADPLPKTRNTLIHYMKIFPGQGVLNPEAYIEDMNEEDIEKLFGLLEELKRALMSGNTKTSLFSIEKLDHQGVVKKVSWNGEKVPQSKLTHFTSDIALHLNTWTLKDIVGGFLLTELKQHVKGISLYKPSFYKYHDTGEFQDMNARFYTYWGTIPHFIL